jgi:hypothetical protein
MAKGETKKTNEMLAQEQKKTNSQFDNFTNTQAARSNDAYGRSNDLYGEVKSGYGDMAKGNLVGGGAFPLAGAGGSGGGGNAGYDLSPTYGAVKSSYNDFMNGGGVDAGALRAAQGNLLEIGGSGGFDPDARNRILGDASMYRDFAKTGGISEPDRARMRGGGVYDEFAKTGGVSAQDATNLRSRGNAPISAMYGGMTEEMNRARRIRGGSSAMGNAQALQMARDRSKASAEAALSTELGITDRTREGRQWGAQGMTQSEGALQDLLTRNQLAGIGGAASTESNLWNSIAQNRTGASTGYGNVEVGAQGLIQKGKMFGTQGMEGIAGAETSAAASQAAAGAANSRQGYEDQMEQLRLKEGLRSEGLSGLYGLRGQVPGEVANYDQNILQGIGGRGGLVNDQLGMRYNAQGNNTNGWQQAAQIGGQILGGAGGIAGGLMTGAGQLRPPARPPNLPVNSGWAGSGYGG